MRISRLNDSSFYLRNLKCSTGTNVASGAGAGAAAGSVAGPWGAAIGAGVGAVGSLISSLIGSSASEYQTDMAWELGKANLDLQYAQNLQNYVQYERGLEWNEGMQNAMNDFNMHMWQKNNEYNSPVSQLQRAQNAGINPNIVFGQPVASSPVQQTSAPETQGLKQDAPQLNISPEMLSKVRGKYLKALGEVLNNVKDFPFIHEKLKSMKLANKSQELKNQIDEYDVWEKESEKRMYDNFGAIRSLDGSRLVSPEEYNSLSDEEKKLFVNPSGYRHVISDKFISPEDYNDLSNEQKKLYEAQYPDLGSHLPTVEKMPFKSAKQFEEYKKLYSFGNTLSNIRADRLQNVLREKVYSGQLADNEYVNAMVKMPEYTFNNLVQDMQKKIAEVESLRKHNVGLAQRLEYQDKIARYTAEKLKNDLDSNAVSIIKKYVPEGGLQSFFLSLYAIVKELR